MKKVFLLFMVLILMSTQRVFAANDWAKEMIGAKAPEGSNIKIAVIDTGVSAISSDRIEKGKNYIIQDGTTADSIGHGTAVTKLILEVAPMLRIIPLVYCTKSDDNKIIKADNKKLAEIIKEAVDVFGCRVINISSGTTENSKDIYEAICYAEERGAVVVSSVGNSNNENPRNIYYPAAYDTVIGVGAVCKDGSVAEFSQRNDSVSLCAPGDELNVLKPNGKYTLTFGTSYATTYVSAAAALILSIKPELTPYDVRKVLYNTALDIEDEGYDTVSGYGLVQIDAALESVSESLSEKIILTIGKTKASIWGEKKENDVAPVIVKDRAMLPARFVAEALGARVEWNEKGKKVAITKDNITIFIYIDSYKAYVNDKEVILDSPAFIENNRAYTPIRFIAENLGVKIVWDEKENNVIITK